MNTITLTTNLFKVSPGAVLVTLGGTTTWGAFDDDASIATDEMGQPIRVDTRELHIAANSLTGVVDGTVLAVRPKGTAAGANVAYTVRGRPRPRENGDLWSITVTR